MQDIHTRLAALGIAIPELLLPKAGSDMQKWAVIACDQFTQDRSYWEKAHAFVADAPSALRLIYPECYLGEADRSARITAIHDAMSAYLTAHTLVPHERGCVYLERSTPYHERRRGLALCIDLEHYDWKPEARPVIRATEGTVEERLPPRMAIRRDAPLETSHILLLIDDDDDALFTGLAERAKSRTPLYESSLMLNSGALSGWLLPNESDWTYLAEALERLAARAHSRYTRNAPHEAPFLFAVGDGNHSLASAKAVWEEYKAEHREERGVHTHPARYALVEIENLYDTAITFEPIHRVLFGASCTEVIAALSALAGFTSRPVASRVELAALVNDPSSERCRFGVVSDASLRLVEAGHQGLATDALQPLLDAFVAAHQRGGDGDDVSMDYIHGETALFQTAQRTGATGLLLPPINKGDLFKTVARRGPLPRKSFSMGEAEEKRFYLECRTLF